MKIVPGLVRRRQNNDETESEPGHYSRVSTVYSISVSKISVKFIRRKKLPGVFRCFLSTTTTTVTATTTTQTASSPKTTTIVVVISQTLSLVDSVLTYPGSHKLDTSDDESTKSCVCSSRMITLILKHNT